MEKYVIFNRNMPFRPLSLIDTQHNSKMMELSLVDAQRYVEENNKKNEEELFYYMKIEEWQRLLDSPQIGELKNKIHDKFVQSPEIREIEAISKSICDQFDKNINGFMIPFEAENNEDYEKKLKECLDAFVKEIDRPAFRNEGELVNDVKNICKMVKDAFDSSKMGDSEMAEKIVEEILEEYKSLSFAVTELNQSYAFRGIAPFDELKQTWAPKEEYEIMMSGELNFFRARIIEKDKTIHEKKEINYLSYSKRDLSRDLRFSSKGKVCLYLGTTSYVCSRESRWNGEDNMYLSSFKFNEKGEKLKILNLAVTQALINGMIPTRGDNTYITKLHNAMIRVFPLVIATMFTIKTSDGDRKKKYNEMIKYEYLLSQVLMNVLQKVGIDGVAYLSRQGKDDFQYPQMVCLAIPVNDMDENEEYGDLINDYVMTSPVIYNGFSDNRIYEKRSYINENYPKYTDCSSQQYENINAQVDIENEIKFYEDTLYSKFDDYLVNQEHTKLE